MSLPPFELSRQSDQFRLLVDAVEDYAIYLIDPNGNIASWNAGAERIKGYSASEVLGEHFSLFYTQRDKTSGKPDAALATARYKGKYTEEGWRVRKDGTEFWAGVIITPIVDEGELVGYAKVTRDLSESRKAELAIQASKSELESKVRSRTLELENACERLRAERSRNEAIVNSISAVIWRWDIGNSTYETIPAWHVYTGLEKDACSGWNWCVALHPDDREKVDQAFRESIKDQSSFTAEYRIRRSNSEYRHISAHGFPLLDEKGNAIEFVGICIDITDQKNLEEQFRHAQKLEAVGQLAGGIAHDFNNLLTVILSCGELLLLTPGRSSEDRRLINDIVASGERAAELTRQLLTFSRRSLVERQSVNVNQIVEEFVPMLRRMIGEQVTMHTILDPNIQYISADTGQMGQILMNLVVNARDAMPEGGVVTIETRSVTLDERYVNMHVEVEKGDYVLLMVSDTGYGMSAEVRSKIFEPFFTTKGVGRGTGLGLSVVHGIVRQYGGKIGAYSEPGLGTVIKIYFPVISSDQADIESTNVDRPKRIGTERVLVVDDDEVIGEIAELALRGDGYTVMRTSSGAEALKLAREQNEKFDLLITDVVMPGMSGRELADKMIDLFPEIVVLYLSGYTDDAVVRHGLLRAEVNFLQKPFTPRMLANKLQDLLD